MMPTLAALLLSAALAAPAPAADPRAADAAPGAPRPATVALRFAWPGGLAADVDYARTRTQTGRDPVALRLKGKLAATARGGKLAVRYHGWTGAEGEAAALIRAAEKVVVVVGEDGRAEAVEGLAESVAALRKLPGFSEDTPQMRKVLELAPGSIEKESRELWAVLVGFWTENDLDVGEPYQMDQEVPVPALPGSSVRLKIEARATRWLDCPGPQKGRCVELTMRSRPDPEDVAKLVTGLMEKLGAPKQAVQGALGELATVTDATLVTEPTTLVPHRLVLERTADLTGPGGETLSRVDEQRWSYAYPAPAKR